ncbi:ATP-binding protein [Patescibacteria group bacterium]|nr:ATP-binding protein [Patescibacteria group bacterium]
MDKGIIGYVHYDKSGVLNNRCEALITKEHASSILVNKFIKIVGPNNKTLIGRVLEGPFYIPEEIDRNSAMAQVAILHGDEFPLVPNYFASINIEILGELEKNHIKYSGTRPLPQSKVITLSDEEIIDILNLKEGNFIIGNVEGYENAIVKMDGNKKEILPRNVGIFGTVGSGKTNSSQVLIEEAATNGWAVIILDVEGEYGSMNEATDNKEAEIKLKKFNMKPEGIEAVNFRVAKLCNSESNKMEAEDITIRIDQIDPYVLSEIIGATEPQAAGLCSIIDSLSHHKKEETNINPILPGGKEGVFNYTIKDIIDEINKRISSNRRREEGEVPEMYVSNVSLGPLKRKLWTLYKTGAFDQRDAVTIKPKELMVAGKITVFDLCYTGDYEKNLLIAQLLNKVFEEKKNDKENKLPHTLIVIEEAHSFVSRDNSSKMQETLRMLKEIARRGRKRWLSLCFISQQPSHLPPEIFELSNTRIVHNIRSENNLNVLRNSSSDISQEMWNSVPSLGIGQAIIDGPQFRNPLVVQMRLCKTKRMMTQ